MSGKNVYDYSGVTLKGDKVQGTIFAEKGEVQKKLKEQGIFLLDLKQKKQKLTKGRFSEVDFKSGIEQLYHLTLSGMRLDQAIKTVQESSRKEQTHRYWNSVLMEVKQGTPLSFAMERASLDDGGWAIPKLYSQMIGIGEEVGDIPEAMKYLLNHLEFRGKLKSEIISSLSYPAFLVVMSCVSLAIVVLVIVPRFMSVFQPEQLTELPLISKIVFSLGRLGDEGAREIIIVFGLLILFAYFFRNRVGPVINSILINIANAIPFIRTPFRHLDLADVYTSLGVMIKGGVGVHFALDQAAVAARFPALRFLLEQTAKHVKEGKTLHSLWNTSDLISREDVSLIAVGESSANLGEICLKLGARHMEQFRLVVRGIMSLFEPALILCLGAGIGFIVTGILLAVLSMTDIAGM